GGGARKQRIPKRKGVFQLINQNTKVRTMPIRRGAAAQPKEEAPPANAPDKDAPTEDTASAAEKEVEKDSASSEPETTEDKNAGGDGKENGADGEDKAKDGEAAAEGEKPEEAPADQGKGKKKKAKDAGGKIEKEGDDKGKKVKKKIPAWATISANKLASTSLSQPKVEEIILEAIESCKERSGISSITIVKKVMKKYPSVEMDKKTKNLYKRALKRMVEKGIVKQLKGKGFSGRSAGQKETLGESLPLIITRLCEPKEASYILIKKYLEQHFPQLNVEHRPDVLKNCLQKSVEKGYLEQITGKGASGTFQLKKAGNKVLMGGALLEDAIVAAITAMNEPKTCSTVILRKFVLDKEKNFSLQVANLKRTLQKCKMMGWMEQISGHGLSGSYQLSYPYYPSPAVLFPEMMEKFKQKEQKRKRSVETDEESDESEEESEEESEDDEPPPKKRNQRANRAPASRARQNKRSKPVSRKPPPKKIVKKAPPPAKKPAAASKAAAKKAPEPVKATPVKKAAPASKPKTPIAKKMTKRGSSRPSPKASKKEAPVKAKPAARKSLRARK
ncbi:hypothetical protein DNTS_026602, partial [Danionella cerebrum]